MKKIKKLKRKEIKAWLAESIDLHERMKNYYFRKCHSPQNARQRREYEDERSLEFGFTYKKNRYYVHNRTSCSAKNIYYLLTVTVNGVKKDVRALKKVLSELSDEKMKKEGGAK